MDFGGAESQRLHPPNLRMVIRVTALTGAENQPSSRYRVRQHIPELKRLGIDVLDRQPSIDRHAELLPPRLNAIRALRWPTKLLTHGLKAASRAPDAAATWKTDLTWLQRELVPGIPSWEPVMKRPLVFDVDDAIWLSPPAGQFMARTLARAASVVIAGNPHLAEWFDRYTRKVVIVPTAVDTTAYVPRADVAQREDFVIGWMGTASNLGFLRDIEPALLQVLDAAPQARVMVVSNAAPQFQRLPPDRVTYEPWSAERENEQLRSFDVGLMPLSDEPWTRGKCAFKMLQYMACGVPAVASPVGMNADVLALADLGFAARTSADWVEALITLYRDRNQAAKMGAAGRAAAERHFSSAVIADRLAALFRQVSGG